MADETLSGGAPLPETGAGPDHVDIPTRSALEDAVREHVAAFNAHDTERLLAGLAADAIWVTGTDRFTGHCELHGLFDDGLWGMGPKLRIRRLVLGDEDVAGVLREELVVNGEARGFDIAVFFRIRDGVIQSVTVFREGSADID